MIGRIFTKNWWARIVAKVSRLGNFNDAKRQSKGPRQVDGQVNIGILDPRFLLLHWNRHGATCHGRTSARIFVF